MSLDNKFFSCEVDIECLGPEFENPYQICEFCGKLVSPTDSMSVLEKLSGPGRIFCAFCLRQRHNTKNRKNILVMSFRGLIAFLYYEVYQVGRLISFSEIEDVLRDHIAAGLKNPLFAYDPETMLWHVDFGLVGDTKKKLPLAKIKETVNDIMKNLRLQAFVTGVQYPKLDKKYEDAIDGFYQNRSRPRSHRLLIPTMKGCGPLETKGQNWEKHKDFGPQNLLVR